MGKFLVFTNAVDGRDDDYNQWYDEVHAVEMCALPEYTGVTRFKLTDAQMVPDQSHAMADVSYHFSNLWFAGQGEDWPLAQFYADETRSHLRWAVRIIPVPGKKAGESVVYGGLLGEAYVQPVSRFRADEFIRLGGRIPAPLQALRN